MSSLTRMLAILDVFTAEQPAWTAEGIAEKLSYTRPTGYRYVRELTNAGLLRRGAAGTYLLGTRIIELDWQIRVSDPVLSSGRAIMRELARQTGCDVMLATMYGERVLTIHQEHGNEGVHPSYGRGRPLPLFRGTPSKAMLPWLPAARLRKLYEAHKKDAAAARLGRDWKSFRAKLQAIKAQGYCVTRGELDPDLVGTAVPVLNEDNQALGSLTLAMSAQRFNIADPRRLVELLNDAARRMGESLSTFANGAPVSKRSKSKSKHRSERSRQVHEQRRN